MYVCMYRLHINVKEVNDRERKEYSQERDNKR